MARKKRNPDAEKLAESILNAYQPESVDDMQDALKDVFGPLFEKMLQGELNNHLGYDAHSKEPKEHDNRRNGYGTKTLKTSFGEVAIDVPRDREEKTRCLRHRREGSFHVCTRNESTRYCRNRRSYLWL